MYSLYLTINGLIWMFAAIASPIIIGTAIAGMCENLGNRGAKCS